MLGVVFALNLLLYALPPTMTYAKNWFDMRLDPLSILTTPATAEMVVRFAGQLAFLSLTMYAGFYAGLWVTGTARSPLSTLRSVADSTGVYLATAFTLLQYFLDLPNGEEFVTHVSKWAVHLPLRLTAEFLHVPVDRVSIPRIFPFHIVPPELFMYNREQLPHVSISQLAGGERVVLGLLAISVCYYVYAFYCSARVDNGADRTSGLVAVGAALLGPYVVVAVFLLPPPDLLPAVVGGGAATALVFLYTMVVKGG